MYEASLAPLLCLFPLMIITVLASHGLANGAGGFAYFSERDAGF
jgi:hypothetical protein